MIKCGNDGIYILFKFNNSDDLLLLLIL